MEIPTYTYRGNAKQNPSKFAAWKGQKLFSYLVYTMTYILHDLHVAVWAFRTAHIYRTRVRLTVTWPIHIRRHPYRIERQWIVSLHRPGIHILNAYEVESDFNQTCDRALSLN